MRITGGRPRPKAARARVAVGFVGESSDGVCNFGGRKRDNWEGLREGDITSCCLVGPIAVSGGSIGELEPIEPKSASWSISDLGVGGKSLSLKRTIGFGGVWIRPSWFERESGMLCRLRSVDDEGLGLLRRQRGKEKK